MPRLVPGGVWLLRKECGSDDVHWCCFGVFADGVEEVLGFCDEFAEVEVEGFFFGAVILFSAVPE